MASLRVYSYDADAYFNHHATTYHKTLTFTKKITKSDLDPLTKQENALRLDALLRQIEAKRIDITNHYKDWSAIGCALANEFGEAGRTYFHRFSQFYLKYDRHETDSQFDYCLRGSYNFSLSSVFTIAGNHFLYENEG